MTLSKAMILKTQTSFFFVIIILSLFPIVSFGQEIQAVNQTEVKALRMKIKDLKIQEHNISLGDYKVDNNVYKDIDKNLKAYEKKLRMREPINQELMVDIQDGVGVYSAWEQDFKQQGQIQAAINKYAESSSVSQDDIADFKAKYSTWLQEPTEMNLLAFENSLYSLSKENSHRSIVKIGTIPSSGATVKYQLRGDRSSGEDHNVYTMGTSTAKDELFYGRYYIWTERDKQITSEVELYLICGDREFNIKESK